MHRVPYTATASVAFPEDLIGKLQYAKPIKGFRFVQVSAPCPTGWRFDPKYAVRVAKNMVDSGLWPLYEVVDGNLNLSYKPKELMPVKDVLRSQGRFRHITDDEVDDIQGWVDDNWARLLEKDGGPVF